MAHPNVQQLLASIWYEGLPGFRRKNMVLQALEIVKIGVLFPFFSVAYIIAPHCVVGQTMRKPFIKFICHSASYFTFLCEYFPLLLLLLLLLFSFYIRFFTLFPHSLPLLSSVSHLVTDLLLLPVRLLKLNRTWFTTSSSFFLLFFFCFENGLGGCACARV